MAPRMRVMVGREPARRPRLDLGATSARKAQEVDRSMPMATPMRKRITHSIHTWVMNAAPTAVTMKTHRLKAKTFLRPTRSAMSPKRTSPRAVPMKEIATRRPLSVAVRVKVLVRKTMATPMTVRS